MVVVVIGKNTLCKLLFSKNETKVVIEELKQEQVKEIKEEREVYIDRTLTQKELEILRYLFGEKTTYEITIDADRLNGLKVLSNLTILLVMEKVTEIPEQQIEFYEPAYYLVYIS